MAKAVEQPWRSNLWRTPFDAWEKRGRALYGENKQDWKFICPTCGNIASITIAKQEWPRVKGRGWNPSAECLGRYVDEIKCNRVAYGFFKGPVFVTTAEGTEVAAFHFAEKVDSQP